MQKLYTNARGIDMQMRRRVIMEDKGETLNVK